MIEGIPKEDKKSLFLESLLNARVCAYYKTWEGVIRRNRVENAKVTGYYF